MAFGAWDYISCSLLMVTSVGIGVYYTWKGRKDSTLDSYFLANRQMNIWPVALSAFATASSSIVFVGLPAETYFYTAAAHFLAGPMIICASLANVYFFLPVLYNLKITSIYEYLEKRFHVNVQRIVAMCFILSLVVSNGVVVYGTYVSIIQIAQVPDLIWLYSFCICSCTCAYTILGGLKAVIWADVIQAVIMYAAFLVLMIKSMIDIGGIQNVIKRIHDGNRLKSINTSFDPTVRYTLWSSTFGSFISFLATISSSQNEMQRLLAAKSSKKALRGGMLRSAFTSVFLLMGQTTGLLMFAYYWPCDPLMEKRISSPGKIVPLFVTEVLGNTPGLCGLLMAGILSASISTLSSSANSLSTVTMQDFVKPVFPRMCDKAALRLSKLLALFYGFLPMLTMHLSAVFSTVTQASFSIGNSLFGCILGVIILGMVFPRCSTLSAFFGIMSSLVLWTLMLVSQMLIKWNYPYQQMSTNSCHTSTDDAYANNSMTTPLYASSNVTTDIFTQNKRMNEVPLWVYRVAHYWHSSVYAMVTIVIGLLLSFIWENKKNVDEQFMPNAVRRMYAFLPQKIQILFGYIEDNKEDCQEMEQLPLEAKN